MRSTAVVLDERRQSELKGTVVSTWAFVLLMPISMMIGHFGSHDLEWTINPISTYAASAPNDTFITLSMYLGILGLLGIAVLVTRHNVLGNGFVSVLVPMLIGGTIAGLLLIANYEETIQFMDRVEDFDSESIQQQAFHNAGWTVFFYSLIGLLLTLGVAVFLVERKPLRKLLGIATFITVPLSFSLINTPWYRVIGLENIGLGLNQRLTILCLWLGIASFLVWVSINQYKRDRKLSNQR